MNSLAIIGLVAAAVELLGLAVALAAMARARRRAGELQQELIRAEERARALGLNTLFVLTTRTAHWFQERGFAPSGVERLPAARASLYNYQRNSKIFEKPL